jgi:hypothetical protein
MLEATGCLPVNPQYACRSAKMNCRAKSIMELEAIIMYAVRESMELHALKYDIIIM